MDSLDASMADSDLGQPVLDTPNAPSLDTPPVYGDGGSVDNGFKLTKKHVAIALGVGLCVWLFIRWRKKGYIFAPKPVAHVEKEESVDTFTKYDHGEIDFRSNGIYIFNTSWETKTFNYMIVADNESIQGKFEWDKPNDLRKGNHQGKIEMSTGWSFHYGKKPQRGYEVASLTLVNPTKKTSYNKIVDFTTKRIG
jgi:hypothetical protein